MVLSGKYAIVTGASSGIGLDIANKLASLGLCVFGLDKQKIKNQSFMFYECDVSDEETICKIISKIKAKTSSIDYLINVAGTLTVNKKCLIKDTALSDWNKLLNNNLTSMFLMIKYLHPLLKESNYASIINISSDQSYVGQIGFSSYGISKAGVNILTQVAALEMKSDNIRVNAIAPNSVKTNILSSLFEKEQIEEIYNQYTDNFSDILLPSDITNLAIFIMSDESKKITGEIFRINAQ